MGSPRQTLSKLIHGDNLKNWAEDELSLLEDKVYEHVLKCQHPRCQVVRSETIIWEDDPTQKGIVLSRIALY